MFYKSISINEDEFNLCKEFSKSSARSQREYRSGGSQIRTT